MKRLVAKLLLLFLIGATLPASAQPEPYDIYVIDALTGPGAFVGHGVQTALGAGEAYINASGGIHGRPIHFVILDDQTSPVTSVQLLNQLIAKKIPAFLGPVGAAQCAADLPIVNGGSGPVSYCLSNAVHPPAESWMFSAQVDTTEFLAASLRYLQAKGLRKIALLTTTDQAGADGVLIAHEDLSRPEFANLQVVDDEHFALADLSVSAQVARIKASGAQVLDAWTTGPPFGTILRDVQQVNYDGIILTNGANLNTRLMDQYAAFMPQELLITGPPYMAVSGYPNAVARAKTTYRDQMRKVGVETPDLTQMLAWDPMLILVDALRHLPDDPTAEQVHAYIENLHGFAGVNGMYDFTRNSQRGLSPDTSVVVRWDKAAGQFVTISKPGGQPL